VDEHWRYNCEDCVRTFEIAEEERRLVKEMGLEGPEQSQQDMLQPVLQAMIRGVRIDKAERNRMAGELLEEMAKREQYFQSLLGHPLNPASPKQMQALFYDDFCQRVIIKRGTGKPTLDDDALTIMGQREPILLPLLRAIAEYRTIGVFLATFVNAPLDADDRMRCSYNICGTETYRLASRKNAFGTGTNLQNVPKGGDDGELHLPNIRTLFIPDPGYTFFDGDLDRADLQVVVWEADDQELKAILREGVDVHAENAKTLGCPRQMAKMWVHGTNYGGTPELWRSIVASLCIELRKCKDDGLEPILESLYGMSGQRLLSKAGGQLRIVMDTDGYTLIELIQSSPKLLPGYHSPPSPSRSIKSGSRSTGKSPKRKSSSKFTTVLQANSLPGGGISKSVYKRLLAQSKSPTQTR
jgi:hypothetical protein